MPQVRATKPKIAGKYPLQIKYNSQALNSFYQTQAVRVSNMIDIKDVVEKHNLSSNAETHVQPVDNSNSTEKIKSAWGVKITIHHAKHRNAILNKIYNALESKADEIILEYQNFFAMNLLNVVVRGFKLTRNTIWSQGSNSIFLECDVFDDDGNVTETFYPYAIFAKGNVKDQGDPHELMTGALIAMGSIIPVANINTKDLVDRNAALDNITNRIHSYLSGSSKMVGWKEAERKLIPGDHVNLAKALSVSNYVNYLMQRNAATVVKVYQTGAAWDAEIRHLEGSGPEKDQLIKSYNSADLIVQFVKSRVTYYWGLSLKKKSGANDDPTLLNKPLVGEASKSGKQKAGYLYLKAQGNEKRDLIKAEDNFWKQVYMVKNGPEPEFPRGKKLGDNVEPTNWPPDKLPANWKQRLDSQLADNEKNAALTGREFRGDKYPTNFFFKELDTVFRRIMSVPANFREFLDLAFRFDIDDYVNNPHFYFSLITGTGDLKNGKIVVSKVEEKSSALMKEVFNIMFNKGVSNLGNPSAVTRPGTLELETTKGKVQAFASNATAAKLFYTMSIDNMPVVNLEVRYKGAITSSPQFQVFITTEFKTYYKRAQQILEAKGIRTVLR